MNLKDIDVILYVDKANINEDYRSETSRKTDVTPYGTNVNIIDPRLYDAFAYGRLIQQSMLSTPGITCEVSDFGKWVVVTTGVSNPNTGRVNKKTFLIVFEQDGDGIILSASNKWRSISGVQQAISYIKSVTNILKNETNRKI